MVAHSAANERLCPGDLHDIEVNRFNTPTMNSSVGQDWCGRAPGRVCGCNPTPHRLSTRCQVVTQKAPKKRFQEELCLSLRAF